MRNVIVLLRIVRVKIIPQILMIKVQVDQTLKRGIILLRIMRLMIMRLMMIILQMKIRTILMRLMIIPLQDLLVVGQQMTIKKIQKMILQMIPQMIPQMTPQMIQ